MTASKDKMNRLSKVIINKLIKDNIINGGMEEEYTYAFETMIEKYSSYSFLLMLALYFDMVIPTIVFMVFFFSIRRRTGGLHLDTYWECLFGTGCIYVFLIKILYPLMIENIELLYILLVLSFFCIIFIGAVSHPNMNWSKEELKETKRSSRALISLQLMSISSLAILRANEACIIFAAFGVILCGILLFIAKIIKQEVKL